MAPTPQLATASVQWFSEALRSVGVPEGLTTPARAELVANVLVVTPLPVLAAAARLRRAGRWGWRHWTAWAFVASLSVEAVQALVLPARSATHVDVVANTTGGLLGGVLVTLARSAWVRRRRDVRGRGL
ncbi:VanZ family protein [Nocardioides perillae]|uniref:VanZ family protein n=1 Tax=Nocardioides perillae TaxID=1119534 RepID=A0A7Y9RUC5_9ACTN|nr:VanZ family protein [Nocardioides perillae]NYG54707.1 VanZ family protein [Nocardioides perillae]